MEQRKGEGRKRERERESDRRARERKREHKTADMRFDIVLLCSFEISLNHSSLYL